MSTDVEGQLVLVEHHADRVERAAAHAAADGQELALHRLPFVGVGQHVGPGPEARLGHVGVVRRPGQRPAQHQPGPAAVPHRVEEGGVHGADHRVHLAPGHGRVGLGLGHLQDLDREVLGLELVGGLRDQQGCGRHGRLGEHHAHGGGLGQRGGLGRAGLAARHLAADAEVGGIGGRGRAAPLARVVGHRGALGRHHHLGVAAVLPDEGDAHGRRGRPPGRAPRGCCGGSWSARVAQAATVASACETSSSMPWSRWSRRSSARATTTAPRSVSTRENRSSALPAWMA